jgi:hypothetical protein
MDGYKIEGLPIKYLFKFIQHTTTELVPVLAEKVLQREDEALRFLRVLAKSTLDWGTQGDSILLQICYEKNLLVFLYVTSDIHPKLNYYFIN